MRRIISFVNTHRLETALFVALIVLATFFRFHNLRSTVIFLGDEGRDALVVKRILVDHKLTLLGPTASVGGFYLGPVYYYFMVPFMFLSGLDPVGPAIMIALMGLLTIIILYSLIRHWFGFLPAFLASLLYALAPGIVSFSRSSWNPNPMPLFTLMFLASFYLSLSHRLVWAILAGFAFGIAIQLHYLGLVLGPVLALLTFLLAPKKNWPKLIVYQIFGFILGASPYFAFELRHGFPNIRSVIEFVSRGGNTTGPRSLNLPLLFFETNRFNLEAIFSQKLLGLTIPLTLLLISGVLAYLFFSRHRRLSLPSRFILIYWLTASFGLAMYKGHLHYHYFQLLFPAPFLVLGMSLSGLKSRTSKIVLSVPILLFAAFLLTNQPGAKPGSNLIDQTHNVALEAIKLTSSQPFNFALIAQGNSDHAYRFFLEIENARPTPLEESVTSQLIIVCELPEPECLPLGNSLWEIAGFGRAEIEQTTVVYPGITIFRLVHHPDSRQLIGQPAPRG